MKKLFGIICFVALATSILLFFQAKTVPQFIGYAGLATIWLIGFFMSLVETVYRFKLKRIKAAVGYLLLTLITLVLLSVTGLYFHYATVGLLCFQAVVNDHQRTNIFTGQCNIGGSGANSCAYDPWYYRKGCK